LPESSTLYNRAASRIWSETGSLTTSRFAQNQSKFSHTRNLMQSQIATNVRVTWDWRLKIA